MTMLTPAEIRRRMTYHAPTEQAQLKHQRLSDLFTQVLTELDELCPESRELSLAVTHAETTKMWASAAVARHRDGSA